MTVYDRIKELGVTEGYSPLLGNCEIDLDNKSIWICTKSNICKTNFLDKEGKYDKNGECLIFPSKENRDWDVELKRKRSQLLPFNTLVMPSIDGNIGS